MFGDVDYLLCVVVLDIVVYDFVYKCLIVNMQLLDVFLSFVMQEIKYIMVLLMFYIL